MRRRAALPALLLALLLPAQAAALCCLPHLTRAKGPAPHHGAVPVERAPQGHTQHLAPPTASDTVELAAAEACGVLATPAPALRSRPESQGPQLAVPPGSAVTIQVSCARPVLTIVTVSFRTSPHRLFSPLRL